MHTVPANCTPLGWQTTEGSLGRPWQAWGSSFLLLPRRHALSRRWLWTFNHNTCENRLEEVQGSATSSLFTPPLFQDTWPCVQLLCAERNAPRQGDMAIEKAKPQASAAKWQGNDQTDLQCQAARHCYHQVQWATCMAWHWGAGPYSEGEKALLVWTCGTLQWCSKDSLSHTGWGKAWAWEAQDDMEAADRGIAESGRSWLSTLMIDIPGDLVWDLPCVQQASYLEGGPLMWMCVQLLCAERNAPCQRDFAIDKAKPPASAAKWQGNDQTDLQCQTARHCHHQVQWATCAAWHWGSGPHSEGEKTPMVWTCGRLQWCSQDSLWHTGWWNAWAWGAQDDMETADREGLQRMEALGHQPSW